MEDKMYHMLLRLPLFQGMSRADLLEVLGQVPFHFRKVEAGKVVYRQGERCSELTFLMNGTLVAETTSSAAPFTFAEELGAYMVMEPQSLFGKTTCYKATYTAQGEVSLLSIDKREAYALLEAYEIFRINMLNMLCSKIERQHELLWSFAPHNLEGRLAQFVRSLCTSPTGTKVMRIKMEDLAGILDDTRLNVSRVLNKWSREGRVEMHRKEFIFREVEQL